MGQGKEDLAQTRMAACGGAKWGLWGTGNFCWSGEVVSSSIALLVTELSDLMSIQDQPEIWAVCVKS